MAKKLYVKLQTPSVEIPVQAEDAGNNTDSITVAFKRYTIKDGLAIAQQFQELSSDEDKAKDFLKSQILYMKGLNLEIYDEDTDLLESKLLVEDTRTATVSSFWGDSKECLSVLVDYYLESTPWKLALIKAFYKAVNNYDFKELETKN